MAIKENRLNDQYLVVGVMSGTSLDGLDLALCAFHWINDKWNWKIVSSETIKYSPERKKMLESSTSLDGHGLMQLHTEYGHWIGKQVNEFLGNARQGPDLIASHGHTVFHNPVEKNTLQIGNGYAIYLETGIPVVSDFRILDILKGGQGAPLVPVGDKLLFPEFEACLNLGGIANVSMEIENKRLAFDIGPCNILLNHYAALCGKDFDKDGNLASTGNFQKKLFEQLNQHLFYKVSGPKSLDKSYVLRTFLPIIDSWHIPAPDVLNTLVHHVAFQVSRVLNQHVTKSILITGGGTRNTFLIECMKRYLHPNCSITLPDDQLIDFKEALIFALLGMLKFRGEINTLASATGAKEDSCSGVIFSE